MSGIALGKHVRLLIASGLTIVLIAGGVAFGIGRIPGADGVIHGCFNHNSGVLRVIDPTRDSCKASESAIFWNQEGVPGQDGIDGIDGTDGIDGLDGRSVLNGTAAPESALGTIGDFYVDTTAWSIYGPKTEDGWGPGRSLIGPSGEDGMDGAPGEQGPPGPRGPAGVVDNIDALNGIPCRVGDPREGTIEVLYDEDDVVSLRCDPTTLYTVDVSTLGSGFGKVTSNAGGIECGSSNATTSFDDCTASFPHGRTVTLTATKGADSLFVEWGGACNGSALTCTVSTTEPRSVTALFIPERTLTVMSWGEERFGPFGGEPASTGGRVYVTTPDGFSALCDSSPVVFRTCSYKFADNTIVSLTAVPYSSFGAVLVWNNCPGVIDGNTCTVTMDQNRTVDARFNFPD